MPSLLLLAEHTDNATSLQVKHSDCMHTRIMLTLNCKDTLTLPASCGSSSGADASCAVLGVLHSELQAAERLICRAGSSDKLGQSNTAYKSL